MSVLLRRSNDLPERSAYSSWVSVGNIYPSIEESTRVSDIGQILENTFDQIARDWWQLGKLLSADDSAELAHTPSCVANISDFGLMLAWTAIVRKWGAENANVLVVTDDPWLFRHLSQLSGVRAGIAPPIFTAEIRLWVRGYLARVKASLHFAAAALTTRWHQQRGSTGRSTILVYGHPASRSDGYDGYYGDLLANIPNVDRLLHVDCSPTTARSLARFGRARSLHAWGNPWRALTLIWSRWKPAASWKQHEQRWLVRRAARLEAGTASGAAIGWQQHCQKNWLHTEKPHSVSWPWENHSWERHMVRRCRAENILSIGYQHSVIGRHMLNYSPGSNRDGLASIPDTVLTAGPATSRQLVAWGIPADRLDVGGTWRINLNCAPSFNCDAPILIPLPFDKQIAEELIDAARTVKGRSFIVKSHPMSPFNFVETENIKHTDKPFAEHPALSAVVYAASTVGLESALAGIPTFRFQPITRMALDILPTGLNLPVVRRNNLLSSLNKCDIPTNFDREQIFAAPNKTLWQRVMKADL